MSIAPTPGWKAILHPIIDPPERAPVGVRHHLSGDVGDADVRKTLLARADESSILGETCRVDEEGHAVRTGER